MPRDFSVQPLSLPRTLDGPDPNGCFSTEAMRRRIRVLFIVSRPRVTPAISVHANLMRYLDRERVEVSAVYPRMATKPPYDASGHSSFAALPQTPEVTLRALEFGPVGDAPKSQLLAQSARATIPALRDMGGLIRFITRQRIDILHCEEGTRNAFYAYLLSRVTPARCIVHFHLGYGDWMSRPSRLAVKRADAIISVSSWTGHEIRDDGVSPQRIFPVLNGIELSNWDPAGVDGVAIRREFGLDPQDPLIVQVAQLVDWKRQHLTIKALPGVLERHPTARLMLVGAETARLPSSGETYTEILRKQVAAAGLEEQVIFTGRRGDVREILAAADVFTLPSVGEPCALALVEAMAMGNPVVSVRAGGTPELVEDGKAGLLGEPDDAEQLAANLLALIDEPERRRRMGEYGRRRTLDSFSVQRMADEVESVYRFVAGTR
jgi:glycosyltransferase involved in cell wall biosynthesis